MHFSASVAVSILLAGHTLGVAARALPQLVDSHVTSQAYALINLQDEAVAAPQQLVAAPATPVPHALNVDEANYVDLSHQRRSQEVHARDHTSPRFNFTSEIAAKRNRQPFNITKHPAMPGGIFNFMSSNTSAHNFTAPAPHSPATNTSVFPNNPQNIKHPSKDVSAPLMEFPVVGPIPAKSPDPAKDGHMRNRVEAVVSSMMEALSLETSSYPSVRGHHHHNNTRRQEVVVSPIPGAPSFKTTSDNELHLPNAEHIVARDEKGTDASALNDQANNDMERTNCEHSNKHIEPIASPAEDDSTAKWRFPHHLEHHSEHHPNRPIGAVASSTVAASPSDAQPTRTLEHHRLQSNPLGLAKDELHESMFAHQHPKLADVYFRFPDNLHIPTFPRLKPELLKPLPPKRTFVETGRFGVLPVQSNAEVLKDDNMGGSESE